MAPSRLLRSMWRGVLGCALAFAVVAPVAAAADPGDELSVRMFPDPDPVVTYAGDVAAILQKNCQVCHQPGGIGPFSLMTYDDAYRYAPVIKHMVVTREMPPYHYDTAHGIQQLKNDWRLSEDEIRTIASWVDAGAPMGDAALLPEPMAWPDWSKFRLEDYFGRPPDVIVTSTPYDVPAMGADRWWRPVVPSGITESRCIAGIETKPSLEARTVAHHANTSFRGGSVAVPRAQPNSADPADPDHADHDADAPASDNAAGGGQLSEYAMGKIGEIIPPDGCRRAPSNGSVSYDIHFYPNGKAVEDATVSVGIWLHPADHQPKYRQNLSLYGTASGSGDLEIPPQGTLMTEGVTVWDHPVRIDSWQPHGHLRLVGAKLEVMDPKTGRKQLLSMVSNWNAGWHHSHVYEDDVAPLIPTGHILIRTQWYDNTDANFWLRRLGGDPDMWVGTGDRTADEMSHQWIAVTHLDEAGYQELVTKRSRTTPPVEGVAAAGRN